MKKLFISQPMNGKADEEILTEREVAIRKAEEIIKEPVEVIDSFLLDVPENATPMWYIGESILLMSEADVAYFVKGWEKYRGCQMEHICAVKYGMDIIEEESV